MAEDSETDTKKPKTEAERLELCQKLDQELDDFISSLERKRYTEGWAEDRWEEEMHNHPFFIKSTPDATELTPLAAGLAKLKFDPEENTPLESAASYKEDGNFNFEHKNYRLAILGYTEGIRQRCDNAEINASLYNNRAAAHWHLKNYRSALYDSEKALFFNPNHTKARLRAAKSAFEVGKYDTCIAHCQKFLETQTKDQEVVELLKTAKKRKRNQLRVERKKNSTNSKKKVEKDPVVKAIIERGIRILNCDDAEDLDLSKLEPGLRGVQDAIVHIDAGILKWPVLLFYPEYQRTDFVKACPENVPLLNQLEHLFPAPWDAKGTYKCSTVNFYFEGYDKTPHVINPKKKLGDLLVTKYYELKAGTPAFVVVPRGSLVESRFLESYL